MSTSEQIALRGIDRYFMSGDLRLHYIEYGSGPDLVIVPGITSPAITWGFVAAPLASTHRVLCLDNRGRGLSDKPRRGFSLEDYTRDLKAMVDELRLERPILLGHSMGARIIAVFSARHPDRAGPLLIVDPPMSGPGRAPYPITRETFRKQVVQARDEGVTVAEIRGQYPRWDEEACRLRAEWLGSCDETAVLESHRSFEQEDILPFLRAVKAPALFLYGEESPVVTAESVKEVAENPELEMVGVPGAAHMLPWENFAGFLAPVQSFLERVRVEGDRHGH